MANEHFVSNDATLKLLGYKYQELMAIETIFNAKINETIWLECKGDVADSKSVTEYKHHFGNVNLSDNSKDFWNTLKNMVEEKNLISQFQYCVLSTTAKILDNSIFFHWNRLTKEEKYKKLKDITPTKTIEVLYSYVFNNENIQVYELLEILEKFTIKSSQVKIEEKWDELVNHSFLATIEDKFKRSAFHQVYGYISHQAILESRQWHIKRNQFVKDMQFSLRKYIEGKPVFPMYTNNEIQNDIDRRDFIFVRELQDIKTPKLLISYAVSDYLKANLSQIHMLEESPLLVKDLDAYDADVFQLLEIEKSELSMTITEEDIGTKISEETSRKLYQNCRNIPHQEINNVEQTQKYYKDGRMHSFVEENKFTWSYEEKDFES